MNREALFCDGTQDYVIPVEPDAGDKILLRFRPPSQEKLHTSLSL